MVTLNSKPENGSKDNFRIAEKKKLYEDIIEQIQSQIKAGKLKSGDRLPPERELAETFRVSRNTVREAIRALEQNLILKSIPGSGTYISLSSEQWIDSLAMSLFQETSKLMEIFQFRRIFEPQVARLAAENASPQDVLKLEEHVKNQEKTLLMVNHDSHFLIKLDNSFHQTLAQASNNEVIVNVVKRINDILGECREETHQSKLRIKKSIEGHEKILKAIKAKDADRAAQETHDHLKAVEEIVLAHILSERENEGNMDMK